MTDAPSSPPGSRGRFVAPMTWLEVEAARADFPVIVVPLGAAAKEHGPHLPLETDWLLAGWLAARVTERARVLTLPIVGCGFYPAFTEYPGSVTIGRRTSAELMADVCRSFSRHGWRKFYCLNTGVSTNRALEPARRILAAEGISFDYTDLLEELGEVEARVRESEGGTHADEIETSMLLHIAPEVVRRDRLQRDYHPSRGPGGLTRDPNATTGVYSPTGTWGDPTRATADKGRIVLETLVERVVAFLERFGRDDFVARPEREEYLRGWV